MNYADKLRDLAAALDARPAVRDAIDEYDGPSISIWLGSSKTAEFSALCRDLGSFDKSGYNGTITAKHSVKVPGDDDYRPLRYEIRLHISGACQKVEKTDADGNPVMVPKRKFVETGELEPDYEWQCPESFLNL